MAIQYRNQKPKSKKKHQSWIKQAAWTEPRKAFNVYSDSVEGAKQKVFQLKRHIIFYTVQFNTCTWKYLSRIITVTVKYCTSIISCTSYRLIWQTAAASLIVLSLHGCRSDPCHLTELQTVMHLRVFLGCGAEKQQSKNRSLIPKVFKYGIFTQSVFSLLLSTGESRKELSFELICSNIGLNLTWGPINVQMTSCRSQLKILKVSERPNASKEGSVSTVIYYYVSKAITPPEYISGYILCV